MGRIIQISCGHCKSKWPLKIEYGMRHGMPKNIVREFPESIQTRIPLEAMQEHAMPWDFAFHPAVCESCASLVSVPVLRFRESGGVYTGTCPECDHIVRLIDEKEIERESCPNCGVRTLTSRDSAMWD